MTAPFVEGQSPRVTPAEDRKTVEVAGAGAATEAIGAAAAIVLAIIGLTGTLTEAMMAVATIVLGAALLIDAGAMGARYGRLLREASTKEERTFRAELGGGISAGTAGGLAGIVLGILALLGVMPVTLCAVALIVFGATLLFGSAAKARLTTLTTERSGFSERTGRVLHEALGLSAGGEILVGIGAVVLGILALVGFVPTTLVLVGFIAVGAAMLLSGTAFGARVFGVLRHAH
jgi:hypothetical protein